MPSRWKDLRSAGHNVWQAAAIAACALGLVSLASYFGAFTSLDSLSFDHTVARVGLSPPAADIVFVDIDEDTFKLFHEFPFPRAAVAELVRQIGVAGPKTFGLDVLLSEPRHDGSDVKMAADLKTAAIAVVAAEMPRGGRPGAMPLPEFCAPAAPGECDDSSPAYGYASINLPLDGDGFIRQSFLAQGKLLSLPVVLAQNFACKATDPACAFDFRQSPSYAVFNGHKLPYWDREQRTVLIGSWNAEPVTVLPAWKILRGEISPATLHTVVGGKVVLLGQSNGEANDQQLTPLFRSFGRGGGLRMPGTAILGAAVRTLLEGTAVWPVPRAAMWGAAASLCWVASFLLLRFRTGVGSAGTAVLAGLGTGASMLLYARARVWLPFVFEDAGLLLTLPLTLGFQFFAEGEERKQLMGLFASYVDPAVADTIWKRRSEVCLAGEERVATVMFTDIRSFTALSFGKPPAEVLRWLNDYLSAMDEVIREHGGVLNKFIGDGLMIIFGLPLSRGAADDAQRALRAAVAMLQRVQQLNHEAAGDGSRPCLRIGIGVHSGPLMAGSIGSAMRQEYSVIGETVNLASRLESQNKLFGTDLLFSEETRQLAGSFPGIVALGGARVPGLDDPVPVYTLETRGKAAADGNGENDEIERTTDEHMASMQPN